MAVLPSHKSTETLFQGDIIPGPKNTVYAVPTMKAGTYHFHCEIHPNLMNGTFMVSAPLAAPPGEKPSATPSPTMSMGGRHADDRRRPAPKPAAPPRADAAATSARGRDRRAATGTKSPRTGAARPGPLVLAGLALAAGGLSVLGAAKSAPTSRILR